MNIAVFNTDIFLHNAEILRQRLHCPNVQISVFLFNYSHSDSSKGYRLNRADERLGNLPPRCIQKT